MHGEYNMKSLCSVCLLTLREEYGLTVFEIGVLRQIFGHMREKVTGDWRRLHNEELCGFYCLSNTVRVIK
jgi:hypothetical protein